MRIIALLFALAAYAYFGAGSHAQDANYQLITKAKRLYTECAYFSVAAQLKQQQARDFSMISELAFQACATEEQALRTTLAAYQVPFGAIEQLLLQTKMDFKRSVQDIAAHPENYAAKPKR